MLKPKTFNDWTGLGGIMLAIYLVYKAEIIGLLREWDRSVTPWRFLFALCVVGLAVWVVFKCRDYLNAKFKAVCDRCTDLEYRWPKASEEPGKKIRALEDRIKAMESK